MALTQVPLDLNKADRKLLTQLPGIAKDLAYKLVNYRKQHGGFSDWSEVQQLTDFSVEKMNQLKQRAALGPRPVAVPHERQVISRWRGKSKHNGVHGHG